MRRRSRRRRPTNSHSRFGPRGPEDRARGVRWHRRLQGRRGLPAAGRRRRVRKPGDDPWRGPFRRACHLVRPGVRTGPQFAVGRARTHPAHPAGPGRRPHRGGTGHRPSDRQLRGRDLLGPAHRHPPGHPGPGGDLPGHAHRDVGAPRGRGQHRRAAPSAACTWSSRPPGAWPAATSARAGWRIRPTSSPPLRDPGPRRSAGRHPADGCHRGAGWRHGRRHRRRYPGAHRPGPLHRQPVVGQAGLRRGRRVGPARRRR